jgi:hypothetical protein
MKYLVMTLLVALIGCAAQNGNDGPRGAQGTKGDTGPSGPDGQPGAPGAVGPTGPTGNTGEPGIPGETGPAGPPGNDGTPGSPGEPGNPGSPGTIITPIKFCPNDVPVYPSTFPEYGVCIDNQLYAVYSTHGGFLALIPPGIYYSNAVGSTCTFTVADNCAVSQ